MSKRTVMLHEALLDALEDVASHSALETKPLLVDLAAPERLRLRFYCYSLVGGAGEKARCEYKVVLRVPAQGVGQYGSFDHSGGRFTTIVGHHPDLEIFVFWDASLHPRFTNGGNLQIREDLVHQAAAVGRAEGIRRLRGRPREVVFACQRGDVRQVLRARIASTGGVQEGECFPFLS